MTTAKPKRGGKQVGSGRPAIYGKAQPKRAVIRMPEAIHAKYLRIGGSKWVRRKISEAEEPTAAPASDSDDE